MLNLIAVLAPHLAYALPMCWLCNSHALPMPFPCVGRLLCPVRQYLLKFPHPLRDARHDFNYAVNASGGCCPHATLGRRLEVWAAGIVGGWK